jgi:uncharacterized RDD family membrane protein YckC
MSYAGIGLRAVAAIVDVVVLFVIFWVVALATGGTTEEGFSIQGAPAFLGFLLGFAYYVAAEATMGGTVGKLLLGLRVVTTDGSPIGWPASLIRNVLRIVDGFFFYVVGIILVMTSPTKQRLGDRVAGTVVVKRGAVPEAAAPSV